MADPTNPFVHDEPLGSAQLFGDKPFAGAANVAAEDKAQQNFHDVQAGQDALGSNWAERGLNRLNLAYSQEATRQTQDYLASPAAKPDPDYKADAYLKQFDEAAKEVPSAILADRLPLSGVVSADDFNNQFQKLKLSYQVEQRLTESGWSGTGAKMLATMLDPIQATAMVASGGLTKIGALGRIASPMIREAIGAGVGNAAAEALKGSVNPLGTSAQDIMLAAGQGVVLGGLLGKFSGNGHSNLPTPAHEAIAQVGEDMLHSAGVNSQAAINDMVHSAVPAEKPAVGLDDLRAKGERPMPEPEGAASAEAPTSATPTVDALEGHAKNIAEATGLGGEHAKTIEAIAGLGRDVETSMGANKAAEAITGEAPQKTIPKTVDEFHDAAAVHDANSAGNPIAPMWLDESRSEYHGGGSMGAASVSNLPRDPEMFHPTGAWGDVRPNPSDGDSPLTAMGRARFDRAGILGSSPNVGTRLMNDFLHNDVVGKADHSLNQVGAEIRKVKIQSKVNGKWQEALQKGRADWAKANNVSTADIMLKGRGREFNEAVGRVQALHESGLAIDKDPHVIATAKAFNDSMKEYRDYAINPLKDEGGVGRSIPGASESLGTENYFTRMMHAGKANALVNEFGTAQMIKLTRKAMSGPNGDMPAMLLDKWAKGYFSHQYRRGNGVGDVMAEAFATGNQQSMKDIMVRHMGMTEEDASDMIARTMPNKSPSEPGVAVPMKKRQLLDPNAELELQPKDGSPARVVKFHDMLVHDAETVHAGYSNRMSGKVALAGTVIKDPGTGEALIHGIVSDHEFEQSLNNVRELRGEMVASGDERGYPVEKLNNETKMLQESYDRILGRPLEGSQTGFARTARIARGSILGLMANVLSMHIPQIANIVMQSGLKAFLQHGPQNIAHWLMPRAGASTEARLANREIQSMGLSMESLHGIQYEHGLDYARAADIQAMGGNGGLAKIEAGLGSFNHYAMKLTGMPRVLDTISRWSAQSMTQRIVDGAIRASKNGGSYSAAHTNRMRFLGLDAEMQGRVEQQLLTHAHGVDATYGGKVGAAGVDKWTDLEAKGAFENALLVASRKAAQAEDLGGSHPLMSNEAVKMVTQFKNFMIRAWSNQTLYAAHNMDFDTFASVMGATVLGAGSYLAREHIRTLGADDRDTQLDKAYNLGNLAAQSFKRVGATSIVPMLWDGVAQPVLGQRGIFERRPGDGDNPLASSFVPPFVGEIGSHLQAVRGLADHFAKGQPMSRQELRALSGAAPFGGFVGAQAILNFLGYYDGAPRRTPHLTDPFK